MDAETTPPALPPDAGQPEARGATAFCALCGTTDLADIGSAIGICLDATACHQRQYAKLRDRADAETARAEAAEARLAEIAGRCREAIDANGGLCAGPLGGEEAP